MQIKVAISSVVKLSVDLAALLTLPVAGLVWLVSPYIPDMFIIGLAIEIALLFAAVFLLALRYKYRLRWLLFRVALFSCSACFAIFALNIRIAVEHHIGEPYNYDAFNGICGRTNRAVPGPGRAFAVLREVECTDAPFVPASTDYFVFVHSGVTSENGYYDLAFSYRVWSDDDDSTEPTVTWLGESSLLIGSGVASTVWTKRSDVNGVQVSYHTRGRKVRREYWWRSVIRRGAIAEDERNFPQRVASNLRLRSLIWSRARCASR